MALLILNNCINCDMCEPECPNDAIQLGQTIYEINPDRCTECVGHYAKPTCEAVCPIHCIIQDPAHPETQAELADKYVQLYQPSSSTT